MFKFFKLKSVTALTVAALAATVVSATPAMAAEPSGSTVMGLRGASSSPVANSGRRSGDPYQILADQINELVAAYDRTTKVFDPTKVSAETLASDAGKAFVAAVSHDRVAASQLTDVRSFVSGGADPWPYVQLTGAEQQAMVTGASGTLVLAICGLLGPETGGVGCAVGGGVIAMIVGFLVANGVCSDDREMRVYPLLGPAGFSCQ